MRRNEVFRKVEQFEKTWNQTRYARSTKRPLDEDDIKDFEVAGDLRVLRQPAPQTMREVESRMKKANFVRWMRLKHDVRWARKQMLKMGRNPEDLWAVLR